MPTKQFRPGETWTFDLPANIPLAARLDAHLQAKLVGVNRDDAGAASAILCTSGTIVPAPELLPGAPAAIRPTVKAGTVKMDQSVNPHHGTLTQRSTRTLELVLTLTPPEGDEREQMTLNQTRTLRSIRLSPSDSSTAIEP